MNGSVSVEFSGDFGADVELQTVNGSLNTNFEMTVSGRLDPKHLRAHVGKPGGPANSARDGQRKRRAATPLSRACVTFGRAGAYLLESCQRPKLRGGHA